MKKIITILLSCLITVGMMCVPVAADIDLGDLHGRPILEMVPGLSDVERVRNITFGDPAPKPRFKINGRELKEDVDFYYRYFFYEGPDGGRGMATDYKLLRKSGYYVVTAYMKDPDVVHELYKPYGITDYDLFIDLTSFYVYPIDLSQASYDSLTETTYDGNEYARVNNLRYNGIQITSVDVNTGYKSGETKFDKTVVISSRNKPNDPFYGKLEIPYKLKWHEIKDDVSITKDEFKYTGYTIRPTMDDEFQFYVDGRRVSKNDYDVELENAVDVGTTKMTITGRDGYTGSAVFDVKIVRDESKPTPRPTSKPTATPTARPTSKPTGNPTATPTTSATPKATATPKPAKPTTPATPKPTTTQTADPKARVMDFVKRIYTYVLDREPEEEGAAFWSDELWSFRRTGAEVGLQFIFSDEFTARGLSNEDFVNVLYKTFFGRDPEEDGFKYWTSALENGSMDRFTVAYGFVYSQEWADTCASYGIRSGGDLTSQYEIEPSAETLAFVERMYTTALGRESDKQGLEYWACELANFRYTGEQVGASFFLCEEMNSYGLANDEFVTRLYKTFMDRDPDADGSKYWTDQMNSGVSRDLIVLGFTRSEEFVNKCIGARILPY